MWLRLAVFIMFLVDSAANTDRLLYRFCNESLLGGKYAVCQETLTKRVAGLFGQETFTKTLLSQNKPFFKQGI